MVRRVIEALTISRVRMGPDLTGVGEMTEFFVFMYAMLAMFVLITIQQNNRLDRPTPQMVTMVGWGLFSLSSTLAVLMGAVALALAFGMNVPLGNIEAML